MTRLTKDTVALIHHIELNRLGWHDSAVDRAVTGVLWMAGEPLSIDQICENQTYVGLRDLTRFEIEKSVQRLSSTKKIAATDGPFSLTAAATNEVEQSVSAAESIEDQARTKFSGILEALLPGEDTERIWGVFLQDLVIPLVQHLGARTYELVTGGDAETHLPPQIISEFVAALRPVEEATARRIAANFITADDDAVREFVLRLLNANLFNLSNKADIAELVTATKRPMFRLLLDTNFVFSVLGLHENPSNEAALRLKRLIPQIAKRADIRLTSSPLLMTKFNGPSPVTRSLSQPSQMLETSFPPLLALVFRV